MRTTRTRRVVRSVANGPEGRDFLTIDARLSEEGTLRAERISLGKLNNVREAIKVAREARTILGGNGVTLDYSPMRHASNLESVLTYEGTSEVHTLVLGNAITGIPAFR